MSVSSGPSPPCLLFITPAEAATWDSGFLLNTRSFQAHGPGGDVTGIPQAAKEETGSGGAETGAGTHGAPAAGQRVSSVLDRHDPQVAGRANAGHAPLFLIGNWQSKSA